MGARAIQQSQQMHLPVPRPTDGLSLATFPCLTAERCLPRRHEYTLSARNDHWQSFCQSIGPMKKYIVI